MKSLYFRVTAIVLGLWFMGTVTNLSRCSLFLEFESQWAEYLLANHSTGFALQTANTGDKSFCFFRVLFQSHTIEEWKIKHLSLSDSFISKMAISPFTYLQSLEILNLSNNAIHSLTLDLPPSHFSPWKPHRTNCNGLPHLKVLILQRNKLSGTPRGLWKLKSLQSLDLSFNGILQIGPSDFQSCLKLENIYLKSNKIFKIHPEAFKDLKKLQVVDLSSNALTTLLPVVTMALEFPHLELDVTDNQWRCEDSIVDFQNFTSESWREKWKAICNNSVGNKEVYLEIPQIRIPRDAHLTPTTVSHIQNKDERRQEGMDMRFSTLWKEAWAGYNSLREMQPQWPTELRNPWNEKATGRKDDNSSDLSLAICLSVFITFVVAFCLGAFARPYVDRLWQQRCLNKSPGSNNAYSNEGFYDETAAARSMQHHQGTDVHQACHHLNLYENQNPSWMTGHPHNSVISERALGNIRTDPGSQQSSVQCTDNTGEGSRADILLQNGHTAHSTLHRHSNANNHQLISTVLDHTYDILDEVNYDTVARECSLHEGSMDWGSSIAGSQGTLSTTTHHEWDELNGSHLRAVAAPLSKTPAHTNTQETGESEERGWPERSPLEAVGSQKEIPVRNTISWLATQQPPFQGAGAEDGFSAFYSEVPHGDPRDGAPQAPLQRWGSTSDVTPAAREPGLRDTPFDSHYNLETNYESDSDEGSLFTLSSEGSEATRSVTEEQPPDEENGGSNQTLAVRTSGEYGDDVTSVESIEAISFEGTLAKHEAQEVNFGNLPTSAPDPDLYETHMESTSNTNGPKNPLTRPRAPGHRPFQPESPETLVYDDTVLHSQQWTAVAHLEPWSV